MFETNLLQAFSRMNIPCDEQKAAQMHRYFSLLLQANAQMNLTNVTDDDDAILLHFCDSASLLPLFPFPEQSRCLDVGTGAGFPGMVLAILCPDVKFTLMDSLQKRVGFLQQVVSTLGLANVQCVHARAEQAAHEPAYREKYQFVVARAVANLRVLSEYCLPFVKTGGQMIAFKGPQAEQECIEAKAALQKLGGKLLQIKDAQVPGRAHRLIFVEKTRSTPKAYPRKAGMPSRQPL